MEFNDFRNVSSECLKQDLEEFIESLLDTKKRSTISGPVPSPGQGSERFSKLLALHNWLRDYCSSLGLAFVDNFDTFWKQRMLYKEDGIHPNHLGAWILFKKYKAALRQ